MKNLFFIIFAFSCLSNSFAQSTKEINSGQMHNAILKKILEKKDRAKIFQSNNLLQQEVINAMYEDVSDIYSLNEVKTVMDDGLNLLENVNIKFNQFNLLEAKKSTAYLLKQKKISSKLSNKFNDIFEKIYAKSTSVESILVDVKSINFMTLTESDKPYAKAFTEIFLASYNLWSGNEDVEVIAKMGWGDLGTVAADTAGGIIGASLGGIGSAIIGGYCSAVWVGLNVEFI